MHCEVFGTPCLGCASDSQFVALNQGLRYFGYKHYSEHRMALELYLHIY